MGNTWGIASSPRSERISRPPLSISIGGAHRRITGEAADEVARGRRLMGFIGGVRKHRLVPVPREALQVRDTDRSQDRGTPRAPFRVRWGKGRVDDGTLSTWLGAASSSMAVVMSAAHRRGERRRLHNQRVRGGDLSSGDCLPARGVRLNSDLAFQSIERSIGDGRGRLGGLQNHVCGANDTLACAAEDVGEVTLLGHRVEGPAGDVVEGVLAGVEPVGIGHHICDRFGFDFDYPAAVAAALVLVKEHVPDFVGEGLDGLGVVDVVADRHQPLGEVGDAVRATEVRSATDVEASPLKETLESVPQSCRCFSGEEGGLADLGVGQRRTVRLTDVLSRVSEILDCSTRGSDGAS